jgi:hypothetical protein
LRLPRQAPLPCTARPWRAKITSQGALLEPATKYGYSGKFRYEDCRVWLNFEQPSPGMPIAGASDPLDLRAKPCSPNLKADSLPGKA